MSDKSKPLEPDYDINQDIRDNDSDVPVEDRQRIFEERFATLMNGFGQACEENDVNIAVAIAIHPDEDEPIVFMRGGEYDAARLLAYVLRRMKQQIATELDTDANNGL